MLGDGRPRPYCHRRGDRDASSLIHSGCRFIGPFYQYEAGEMVPRAKEQM